MVVCTLYRLIGAFASLPLCRTGSRSVRTRIRLASALGANCGPLGRIGASTNANVGVWCRGRVCCGGGTVCRSCVCMDTSGRFDCGTWDTRRVCSVGMVDDGVVVLVLTIGLMQTIVRSGWMLRGIGLTLGCAMIRLVPHVGHVLGGCRLTVYRCW
jgi:hypothetical protein